MRKRLRVEDLSAPESEGNRIVIALVNRILILFQEQIDGTCRVRFSALAEIYATVQIRVTEQKTRIIDSIVDSMRIIIKINKNRLIKN